MQIIGGAARNIILNVPAGVGVRPTAGRARKALFDSLGVLLAGGTVLDLFAGSGALALESASRGAAKCVLVESDPKHLRIIEENIEKVRRAGVTCDFEVIRADASQVGGYLRRIDGVTVIFADPPYPRSAEFFAAICSDPLFREKCGGAFLVWEIPDTPGSTGLFLAANILTDWKLRKFGGTDFLTGRVPR